MKSILLILLVAASTVFNATANAQSASLAAASPDSKENAMARASAETIHRLSAQIRALKNGALPASRPVSASAIAVGDSNGTSNGLSNFDANFRCNPNEPEPTTCVQHCNSRYTNGTCASYGQDYCGPNAACVPNCNSRYTNGTCASYGADVCGAYASCAENCQSRYTNGTCASYGPDICN